MIDIQIETERLLLRPFQIGDEAQVLVFSSNPIINRYTGDPIVTTLAGVTKLIIDVWHKDYKTYGYGRFAVIDKTTNTIIGFCGIKYQPELEETDLGYRFIPKYWGKGIATESSKAILEYAFNDIKLDRVVASVYPENKASNRVLQKLNFQYEKSAPYPDETDILAWYALHKKQYEG